MMDGNEFGDDLSTANEDEEQRPRSTCALRSSRAPRRALHAPASYAEPLLLWIKPMRVKSSTTGSSGTPAEPDTAAEGTEKYRRAVGPQPDVKSSTAPE